MTTLGTQNQIFANDQDSKEAAETLQRLGAAGVRLEADAQPLPPGIAAILDRVLEALASGTTVTLTRMPEDLTSVAAAKLIGVSRPTLLKMVADGKLPAHKVGSHTRVATEDVLKFLRDRQGRRAKAFEALRSELDNPLES